MDAASGQAWVGFHSLESGSPGLYVNAIGPGGPQGGRKLAPGSVEAAARLAPGNRTSLTGRIGAPGVYLFFGQGYPTFETRRPLARRRRAPASRGQGRRQRARERRSRARRPALAHVGARRDDLRHPDEQGCDEDRRAQHPGAAQPRDDLPPERRGSAGPLDLIANVNAGGQQGALAPAGVAKAPLTASSRKAGTGRVVTFRVLDAGDPVARRDGEGRRADAEDGCERHCDAQASGRRTGEGNRVEGRLRRVRAHHGPLSQSPFRAREGCTRGGSPGILGKFGG